jgi:hypothetical protein
VLVQGHFVLLPITIKRNSCIGLKCSVHAGAVVPPNTYMGPLTSSHETNSPGGDQQKPQNRRYCRPTYTPPPWYLIVFVGVPVLLAVTVLAAVPWFLVLKLMVSNAQALGWYKSDLHSVYKAFLWWITPQRLFYFLLLRVIKRCVVPFLRLGLIICVKRLIVGEFTEMAAEQKSTAWNRFRYWLMQKLLPGGKLAGVTPLVGTHYEIVSIIYRLLGAKVGHCVTVIDIQAQHFPCTCCVGVCRWASACTGPAAAWRSWSSTCWRWATTWSSAAAAW